MRLEDGGSVEDRVDTYEPGSGRSGSGDERRQSSTDRKRHPLGVPDDYRLRDYSKPPGLGGPGGLMGAANRALYRGGGGGLTGATNRILDRGRFATIEPRYFDGDEWKPASRDPDSIVDMQRSLVIAGFLSPTDSFRLGAWDEPTRDAYKSLLEYANASGLTADVALQRYAEGTPPPGGTGGGGGSGQGGSSGPGSYFDPITGEWVTEKFKPPPLELRTSNKEDLRRVMRSAVIDKLGEGWSQAQIDELVDAYNWEEIRTQKDAYDQQVAGMEDEFYGREPSTKPITQVDVASPETFLEDELQKRDPVGVQEGQVVQELVPSVLQNLKGWV